LNIGATEIHQLTQLVTVMQESAINIMHNKNQKDRPCMSKVTLRHVHKTITAMKSNTYYTY